MKVHLTQQSKDNLCKLATYLQSLPYNYKHFDMASYLTMSSEDREKLFLDYLKGEATLVRTSCYTSACAAGHGPAAGIPHGDINEDWNTYCHTNFLMETNGRPNTKLWNWLFDGEWEETDNHHYGAAARMRYVLDKGEIPSSFNQYNPESWKKSLYAEYRVMTRVPLQEKTKEHEPA